MALSSSGIPIRISLKKENAELKAELEIYHDLEHKLQELTLGCLAGIDESDSYKFIKLNKIIDLIDGFEPRGGLE